MRRRSIASICATFAALALAGSANAAAPPAPQPPAGHDAPAAGALSAKPATAERGAKSRAGTKRRQRARARMAAPTFNLNAPTFQPLGCTEWTRWLRTSTGWAPWFSSTLVCKFQEVADEYAIGLEEDYYYRSTQGWVLYRVRKCGAGSGTCYWLSVRPGF